MISAEQADKYEKEVRKVLLERFQPSYEALISFLESDIKNTDEVATGVHRLENGEAYYNALLKNYTTTDLTAEEIHQIGLDEVERLTNDMIAIKEKVDFDGDLQDFLIISVLMSASSIRITTKAQRCIWKIRVSTRLTLMKSCRNILEFCQKPT